jgi:hypothetical protein
MPSFLHTVILETNEPFGPEIRVMHEEAESAKEAALRALHHWHNDMEFDPTNTIEELEDRTARVLAVLKGHCEKALARSTSQQLV